MVNCRVIVPVLAAFLVSLGTAFPAAAATPDGPRLAISLRGDGPGPEDEFSEVITTGPAGENPQPLLRGSGGAIGEGLSWAGDGNGFAFSAGVTRVFNVAWRPGSGREAGPIPC